MGRGQIRLVSTRLPVFALVLPFEITPPSLNIMRSRIKQTRRLQVEQLETRALMASDLLYADLWVDSNRDSRIDARDNFGEDIWRSGSNGRGAIVLPNLDRDNTTTKAPDNWAGGNFNGLPVPPNNVIDNAADLRDIALVRLNKLNTDAIYNYRLTISIVKPQNDPSWFGNTLATDRVRLFMPTRSLPNGDTTVQSGDVAVIGPGMKNTIVFAISPKGSNEYPITMLAGDGGFFFGIEGIKSGANVRIVASLEYAPIGTDGPPPTPTLINRDVVEMKVAPFVLQNNLQSVDRAIVEDMNRYGFDNAELRQSMRDVFGTANVIEADSGDLWQQDGYEIGYVQAPYGAMTVILDLPRSREVFFNDPESMRSFIRGRLLGPGIGVNTDLADFPIESNSSFGGDIDSLVKPGARPQDGTYLLMSNMPSYMRSFFHAQGVRQSIDLPLEWLGVNHVDEVIQQSPDGKHILIADPDLAWALLLLAAKADPNVRLHANMNGNEFLPGYTRQGLLATDYLTNENLRWQNLIFTQRATNLGGVYKVIRDTLDLTEEVTRPKAASSNVGTAQLRTAGVFTQMLGSVTREFRVRFLDGDRYVLQYRDGEIWSRPVTGSRLKDETFLDGKAFLFKHYWVGTPSAGDVFTFRNNPDATLIKMPVMFASPFALFESRPSQPTGSSATFGNPGGLSLPNGPLRVSPFSVNHINSLVSGTSVITGTSYGPRVDLDGQGKRDLFQDYARKVFLRAGYKQIRFADSTLYHNAGGSIHCGTNAIRELPESLWWQVLV
jgi:Protein-arginine deiminase (PAD)